VYIFNQLLLNFVIVRVMLSSLLAGAGIQFITQGELRDYKGEDASLIVEASHDRACVAWLGSVLETS
jgi:hypothetical protein